VFDLVIRSVRLTHPTEKNGRAYGRILGSAVGWLELPPEPAQPEVIVSELSVPAVAAQPPAPLPAAVYRQPLAADAIGGEASPIEALPPQVEPAQPLPAPVDTPRPLLLSLTGSAVVVGLGLFIGCGAGSMGLWALFMFPTLLARRMFTGVLRDGGFLRGLGFACIALQAFCVSHLVSSAWSSGCPRLSLWPMLGVIALLFPAGLLPSIIPLSCNALGLALVLTTFCQAPAGPCNQPPRITPAASAK
jgi:hypothetical protein